MKKLATLIVPLLFSGAVLAQNARPDVVQRTNNAVNKVSNIIAVFQPYLLKARQIFYDGKQLAGNVKNAATNTLGKNGANNNTGVAGGMYSNNNSAQPVNPDPSGSSYQYGNNSGSVTQNQGSYNSTSGSSGDYNNTSNTYNSSANNNTSGGYNNTSPGSYSSGNNIQAYLPDQSLPINNTTSVNNDGTGNWGNQNNGLYGNCLDALTGTVLGMGEASQSPASVDLLFFAPADGQNTYYLMTPGFARNNGTATYMTEHTSDQVQQWSDVNETEVALTKLTIGQFEQIQNNNQILNAVKNAQNYAGYYSSVGQKLDGHVFAIRAQMDNREVYALVAIVKQIGTSGNNGYLKIKIKAQGMGANGQVNANAYVR
ncbi:hypothetical protein [Mucilaginibacter sp.]|uniref:hypothetical protein n=1 Tax=Mucilaginibacter sp. TaxID=1882438 RepID=UPI00284ADF7C|nr:hypothetical protein [Mucilaginibacter sp.]MDR3692999.1 hypothetical protein [Mucilaginibacter sp.]